MGQVSTFNTDEDRSNENEDSDYTDVARSNEYSSTISKVITRGVENADYF